MTAPPILLISLTIVAAVSATGSVSETSHECVCTFGVAATGDECPSHGETKCRSCHGKLVLINGACTRRKWAKFNVKVLYICIHEYMISIYIIL